MPVLLFYLISLGLVLPAVAQNGQEIFKNFCSGCHGANLQGTTSATPLIKDEFKHGSKKNLIASTIKNGVPGTTMIAWKNILNEDEIDALAGFILASQSQPSAMTEMEPVEIINTIDYDLQINKIDAGDLITPWGIEFVNEDTALISGKKQGLRWFVEGAMDPKPITGLPPAFVHNETSGYLDLALDPDYQNNGWIYLALCHTNGDFSAQTPLSMTKIVRGKIIGHQWTNEQTLYEVEDSLMVRDGSRWGSRLLFDDDGHLYFTIGEMVKSMDAQDLSKTTGKIFRINRDGSIPKDNPFLDQPEALQAIFSIGNRNAQGIAQHPQTGEIWSSEHGPKGGDELNIINSGANYGWPVITYGVNYDNTIISDETHWEGMEQPVMYWTPSIAVSAIEFNTSHLFPKWKNNLMVGSLAFQELWRLVIEKDRVIHSELIFKNKGRIRDVKFAPNGALFLLMNDPDAVFEITPLAREEQK